MACWSGAAWLVVSCKFKRAQRAHALHLLAAFAQLASVAHCSMMEAAAGGFLAEARCLRYQMRPSIAPGECTHYSTNAMCLHHRRMFPGHSTAHFCNGGGSRHKPAPRCALLRCPSGPSDRRRPPRLLQHVNMGACKVAPRCAGSFVQI